MTDQQSNKESLYSMKSIIKDSLDKTTIHLKFNSDDDNEILNLEENINEKKVRKKRKKLENLPTQLIPTNEDESIDNEISFEEEKKRSLAILDQITSSQSSISKSKTKMIRFDPSKTEHRIYEMESGIKNNGEILKISEEIKTKGTTPSAASERTYEIDQSKLKSTFDKTSNSKTTSNENGQFQFQFFDNTEPIILPIPKITSPSKPVLNGKSKIYLNKLDDTSGDTDDHKKPLNEIEIKNETFFFFDIDDRLKDGLDGFVRTEDLNELDRTWPIKRKEIGEALRAKHRKAIQRKDKHRVFNHRRRQQQYSSSNPISKSNID